MAWDRKVFEEAVAYLQLSKRDRRTLARKYRERAEVLS